MTGSIMYMYTLLTVLSRLRVCHRKRLKGIRSFVGRVLLRRGYAQNLVLFLYACTRYQKHITFCGCGGGDSVGIKFSPLRIFIFSYIKGTIRSKSR